MRRRGAGVKRREISLACDQFPKLSPWPETPKEIHSGREDKGEGGHRGDLGEKKVSQRGEGNQPSNHTPK